MMRQKWCPAVKSPDDTITTFNNGTRMNMHMFLIECSNYIDNRARIVIIVIYIYIYIYPPFMNASIYAYVRCTWPVHYPDHVVPSLAPSGRLLEGLLPPLTWSFVLKSSSILATGLLTERWWPIRPSACASIVVGRCWRLTIHRLATASLQPHAHQQLVPCSICNYQR